MGRDPNSFVGNPYTSGPNSNTRILDFLERESWMTEEDKKRGIKPHANLCFQLKGGYNSGGGGLTRIHCSVPYDEIHNNDSGRTERIIRNSIADAKNLRDISVSPGEIRKAVQWVDNAFKAYRSKMARSQHGGYYSPNLVSHSLFSVVRSGDELYHHGVKGQRWGVTHEDKPNGRDRKTVTSGSGVNRRGEGLGTGPVGSGSIHTGNTSSGRRSSSSNYANHGGYYSPNLDSKKDTVKQGSFEQKYNIADNANAHDYGIDLEVKRKVRTSGKGGAWLFGVGSDQVSNTRNSDELVYNIGKSVLNDAQRWEKEEKIGFPPEMLKVICMKIYNCALQNKDKYSIKW